MNSHKPQVIKPVTASSSRPVFNRYPYSDVESELKRILAWFETNLVLTTEDCVYELKIANPQKRIRALCQMGHVISTQRHYVKTICGRSKKTTVYFLHRKLASEQYMLTLKGLIARVPGFEDIDVDAMDKKEAFTLYFLLRKLK